MFIYLSSSFILFYFYLKTKERKVIMSVLSLTSAFRSLQPFKQSTVFNGIRALQLSFSTSATKTAEQPIATRPQIGVSSLFENVQNEAEEKLAEQEHKAIETEYRFSTANFKTSPQKLNMLARQLRNLPVDEAIRQMEFSDKKAARKILHNLAFAKKNAAEQKGMKNMIIAQAWVGKGRFIQRINFHGRGQFGVMHHKQAHMKFIFKEASSVIDTKTDRRNVKGWKQSNKTWVPLKETKPIYNPKPFYNW
ncbi:ribosomal protein L22/L17 [Cokeromyces recurvatus]|uniref:ribosomal protein L22/L17 n=1 Tax=Cokeromyces recurvatus TaxID=90255 RepID=UPI0022201A70|nr:ribosomal protein L22/L17 [Cokeromyces recurvatus]KAI7902580.1 ribosomal protein L22/L17 [Cokeromyces recurvatus]